MTFTIYPAVDIKGGRAVRLLRGEMADETVYGDPAEMARRWADLGAEWIHVVDLDGAVEGRPVNLTAISAVLAVAEVPVQLGGGLRDHGAIEAALSAGCERVVLGSAAIENPESAVEAASRWPGRIALGLDLRDGEVSTRGWKARSGMKVAEAVGRLSDAPFGCVITTDISRDGALAGPGIDSLVEVLSVSPWPVVASGGVTGVDDIRAIRQVEEAGKKVTGAIVGRALYEGTAELPDLLAAAGERL